MYFVMNEKKNERKHIIIKKSIEKKSQKSGFGVNRSESECARTGGRISFIYSFLLDIFFRLSFYGNTEDKRRRKNERKWAQR